VSQVDPKAAVPLAAPRMLYVFGSLFLAAVALFGLRYGIQRRMDLTKPLTSVLIDAFGAIAAINAAGATLFGRDTSAVLGQPLSIIFHPEDAAVLRTALKDRRTGAAASRKMRLVDPHGRTCWVDVQISGGAATVDGAPTVLVTVAEATARRQAERAASEQDAQRRVLAAFHRLLTAPQPLQGLTADVLAVIGRATVWDVCAWWELNPEDNALHCRQFWHLSALPLGQLRKLTTDTVYGPGEGIVGQAWTSGRPKWLFSLDTEAGREAVAARAPGSPGRRRAAR